MKQNGHRDDDCEGDDRTDHEIQVSDGSHTCHCREEDDKSGHDPEPSVSRNGWEDQVQDVTAADELIAGDDHVRDDDGDCGEDAGAEL